MQLKDVYRPDWNQPACLAHVDDEEIISSADYEADDTEPASPPAQNSDDEFHAQIAAIIDEARLHLDDLPESDLRGLPKDFLRRWEAGYMSNWRHPKIPNVIPTPRVIFRLGDNTDPPSFNAILTNSGRERFKNPDRWEGRKSLTAGSKLVFNPAALDEEISVITEGEWDCLSIMFATDERIKVCALGGAGQFNDLERRLKLMERRPFVVILFDKDVHKPDTPGQKCAAGLLKSLSDAGIVAVAKFFDDFMTDEQKQIVGNKIDANAILTKLGQQALSDLTDKLIDSAREEFPAVEEKIREQAAFRKIEKRRNEPARRENFSADIQDLINRIITEITDVDLEKAGYIHHSERGAKAPDGYCCPWCNSGDGDRKTGAMKYITKGEKPYFGCAACGGGGNVIKLIAHVKNLPTRDKEFFDTLKAIADEFNINYNPKIFERSRRFARIDELSEQPQSKSRDAEIIAEIRDACEWRHVKDANGNVKRHSIKPTQKNLDLIFEHDPNLRGLVGYDQFQGVNILLKRAPWHDDDRTGEQWHDTDDAQLRVYLRKTYADLEHKQRIEDSVVYFAHRNAFHAVKQFLSKLPKWDGVPRAENLLVKFLHAEDSEYTRVVTMNFLFGALARIFHPGCDFQTCLVLNGAQRIGKSKLVKMLGGKESVNPDGKNWHVALKDSLDDMHAIDALSKGWIIEIEEFSPGRKAEINAIKSFISASDDTRRFAYDRYASTRLRHVVFIVTCNDKAFLRDQTGNCRFIVVKCSQKKFDRVAGMTPEYIRQVWAEALVKYRELFKDGFDESKLQLPLDIQEQAESIAEMFTQDDGLKLEVQGYLDRKIPPQVIWTLLTKEQRRKFISDGKITFGEGELEMLCKTRGGRNATQDITITAINSYLTSGYALREVFGTKDTPQTRYIVFGSEYRQHICAAEVWNEAFGQDRRKSPNRIAEVLSQLDGWTLGKRLRNEDPQYPDQRQPYYRDEQINDEPPPDDNQSKTPKDDFEGELIDDSDLPL